MSRRRISGNRCRRIAGAIPRATGIGDHRPRAGLAPFFVTYCLQFTYSAKPRKTAMPHEDEQPQTLVITHVAQRSAIDEGFAWPHVGGAFKEVREE